MENTTEQIQANHRYFSSDCFNRCWDLMDKAERSEEENLQMLSLSFSSYWHWSQRNDVSPTKLSISFWQISRVYAVLQNGQESLKYAQYCLRESEKNGVEVFYLAYAQEAMSRALFVLGRTTDSNNWKIKANQSAEFISDQNYRDALFADLNSI